MSGVSTYLEALLYRSETGQAGLGAQKQVTIPTQNDSKIDPASSLSVLASAALARVKRVAICRVFLGFLWLVPLCFGGCIDSPASTAELETVWGRRGLTPGRLQKPRAMAINRQDQVFIVDMTGRIQAFDRDGTYLHGWRTPEIESGRPCGLTFDSDGNLLVADTHYFRVLVYTPGGELLSQRTIGGTPGNGPGQFTFLTDVVEDSSGNLYVCEYGDFDRVQKFTADGQFVMQWGGHGSAPGEFIQPRNLAIDDQDHIWVADACNHRIQVFDARGEAAQVVRIWGTEGVAPGQLRYPYGLALDGKGHVYVAEFGNSRVQKFTVEGEFVASWGVAGRLPGELNQPWSVALDSQGSLLVLDTYNHRVQRIRF